MIANTLPLANQGAGASRQPPGAPGVPEAREVLAGLWQAAGLEPAALPRFTATGHEPALRSSFAIGTALQAALGAAALAATEVARRRDGAHAAAGAQVRVGMLDVVREACCRFRVDGRAPEVWDKLSGLYRCGIDDGRGGTLPWVRIHANFAHHRDGALALLGLPTGPATERAVVEAALAGWRAADFEQAAADRGLVVAALRTPEQWAAHPQAAAVAAAPLVELRRAQDAPARGWPRGDGVRPLAGLRVLELTRILAGPVAGRTLAALGAEVLLINGPHLPNIEALAVTSLGKRSAHVDLRTEQGRDTLRRLVGGCDVFLHGYRPGALAALGFGPDELEAMRPGLVSASLSAYGTVGPWGGWRGFDSLVQSATGINIAEAQALGEAAPRPLPVQALDFGAGYLLAFGALAAVLKQRQHGGSWRVQLSLAGVGRWLQQLGRIADPAAAPPLDLDAACESRASGFGTLLTTPPAVHVDERRIDWGLASMPPGSHAPAWAEA